MIIIIIVVVSVVITDTIFKALTLINFIASINPTSDVNYVMSAQVAQFMSTKKPSSTEHFW